MLGLKRRNRKPEIMDQPGLEPARHEQALRGLARINFFSGSVGILWPALRGLARETQPLRILDIATGAGDVPIGLCRKARAAGVAVRVEAWDISSTALEFARARAERCQADVTFRQHDALADDIPGEFDAIISSLFLHHLEEELAVRLLRRMGEAARRLVLVNDLARGVPGFLLAHLATRVLTLSDVVHVDGPRSVEAAFTPAEALALAERAGLHGASVARRWPCRFLLTWRRP